SQETKWVGMAMALSCRELRFQGREGRDRYMRAPWLRMGAQASGSLRFAFPDGSPSFLASRANERVMAQNAPQGKRATRHFRQICRNWPAVAARPPPASCA